MWIVMTSSAQMPSSVRSPYRNVAVVKVLSYDYNRGILPAMISHRARGVFELIHLGHHFVGRTKRCAFQQALARANEMAFKLNNSTSQAEAELLMSWGGSA